MPKGNDPKRRWERAKNNVNDADIPESDKTAILDTAENLADFNGNPGGTPALNTRAAYAACLRKFAVFTDRPLTGMDAEELNAEISDMADSRGWADSTAGQYQSAVTAFAVRQGFDREKIDVSASGKGGDVDERTVLEPSEFHEMRENAGNQRDKALIDLFGYTGQRIRVIQTLKIRDVKPEEGIWYLPDDEVGLKGADRNGKKRPLLGAAKSVREWVQMHPTGNPDDNLITPLQSSTGESGEPMAYSSIRERLRVTADRAGIDKPVNPHAFRHFFVTVCKTEYDMDDETVKHLIGHGEESRVMETTYRHLSDEYHVNAAKEAFGIDDGEDTGSLTPPVCVQCQRPLRPEQRECPTCGMEFSPERDDSTDEPDTERTAAEEMVSNAVDMLAESEGISREKAGETIAEGLAEMMADDAAGKEVRRADRD